MSDFITVKVGQVPSSNGMQELVLDVGSTAEDAVDVAGLTTEGYQFRVNGAAATSTRVLNDGDRVVLSQQIKGNNDFIEVTVAQVPGSVQKITLNGERTVRAAADLAGIEIQGYQPRLNGAASTLDANVRNGDRVVFSQQIKGNG